MLKRLATIAVTGILAGLALSGQAMAAPGPSVTFTGGGLGLLLCGSKPSTPKIVVSAESRVKLTNSLGMSAELRIDGAGSGGMANGESVEVQFHRGPVAITMVPECALNLNPNFQALTVEVTAPPPAAPPRPSTTAPKPSTKPSTPAPAAPPAPGAELPALPSDPLFPDDELSNLPFGGTPTPGGGTLDASPASVFYPDGSSGNRTLDSGAPLDKGPIGLLAIIATVCVVGVSAGAIRAIITQRATRAEFA